LAIADQGLVTLDGPSSDHLDVIFPICSCSRFSNFLVRAVGFGHYDEGHATALPCRTIPDAEAQEANEIICATGLEEFFSAQRFPHLEKAFRDGKTKFNKSILPCLPEILKVGNTKQRSDFTMRFVPESCFRWIMDHLLPDKPFPRILPVFEECRQIGDKLPTKPDKHFGINAQQNAVGPLSSG
jgi:hypothetical protein